MIFVERPSSCGGGGAARVIAQPIVVGYWIVSSSLNV